MEGIRPLAKLLPHELQPRGFPFDAAQLEELVLLALCPRRPDDVQSGPMAHIKIKGSNQIRQIPLPGRLGLFFNERGDLCLGDEGDRFWLEIELQENKMFAVSVFLEMDGELQSAQFRKAALMPLVQKMEELFQEEPFQALSKARWLGTDLVCKAGLGLAVQKMEIGSALFDIAEGDRLYWDGLGWVKESISKESVATLAPLMQARNSAAQGLELDVWDSPGERHMRVAAPLASLQPSRVKVEEWFSSIRIRSEKQISCLLEKQCLILREGDWALKENGRWRVLRKAEDKQQMIDGKRFGDLIVFESIDAKRRLVQGQFILPSRIHGFPFSLTIAPKVEKRLRGKGAA